MADQLGILLNVRWLDRIDNTLLADAYRRCASSGGAMVVASRDESFGMAVAEALMYDCPVISNERDELVYMSRVALPGFKDVKCAPKRYKKQVCIYAFTREELTAFRKFGRKSELEYAEDIEILRFLELGKTIRMV
ncbi:glycosyltransferase [Paenalcaligenes hominis]|uniref:glycosyltransferase n=1 Tax=Paenalcaligenes hominis TaxID=643674 RepID=UPI00352634E5